MFQNKHAALLCVALLVLAVCPFYASAQEKVIKIGAMYPMTGRPGQYGLDSVDAAEMAVEEINS